MHASVRLSNGISCWLLVRLYATVELRVSVFLAVSGYLPRQCQSVSC